MTAGKADDLRDGVGDGAGRDSLRRARARCSTASSRRAVAEPAAFSARSPPPSARSLRDALRRRVARRLAGQRTCRRARSLAAAHRQAGRALHPRDQEGVAVARARSDAGADPAAIARGYAGVADALSVLTDRAFISAARSTTSPPRGGEFDGPILAKDFFIDPRQVVEARIAGADAVLVMLSLLDDDAARAMIAEARRLRHGRAGRGS